MCNQLIQLPSEKIQLCFHKTVVKARDSTEPKVQNEYKRSFFSVDRKEKFDFGKGIHILQIDC